MEIYISEEYVAARRRERVEARKRADAAARRTAGGGEVGGEDGERRRGDSLSKSRRESYFCGSGVEESVLSWITP
ncbi:hypothetical protein HPP92_025724 [Vanilla planifolia]|uniref:Uncharacterized protein n=1 Tax=Vanilla planifolia TaxID=51239 RepID=A0A835PIJ5_VANPL|nr:hypothetical protein HPP92_025724 [Vanilla planifolia]